MGLKAVWKFSPNLPSRHDKCLDLFKTMFKPHYIFIRHGKPDLGVDSYEDLSFSSLCQLADGTLDPHLDIAQTPSLISPVLGAVSQLASLPMIFCGPSKRSTETAAFLGECIDSSIDPIVIDALDEVHFSLHDLIQPKNGRINLSHTNRLVFEAMRSGKGAESLDSALGRVETFFVKNLNGPALTVAHDFILRVVELYIRAQGNVRNIHAQNLFNTQRNDFCCGFMTDEKMKMFERIEQKNLPLE